MKKKRNIKKIGFLLIIFFCSTVFSQQTENEIRKHNDYKKTAKELLDEVSSKMGAYKNIYLDFSISLVNKEAGINENDELPINGKIFLQKEKYNLNYLGNNFVFDGKKLCVINHDEKEISINDEYLTEDDGFIYPSKLLTFYKKGYKYSMSNLVTIKREKIQFVELIPIDSDSEIINIKLGINLKTKHIYQLIQLGENMTKTTLTIHEFKSNQNISDELFKFDKEAYEKQGYLID